MSTTPCMPGHYGEVCAYCAYDQYKSTVGTGACFDCANKPENAQYNTDNKGNNNSICPYNCGKSSLSNDRNPNCYTPIYYYIDQMGGYPGIVGIFLTLFFILIIVLFRFFKKKKNIFRESIDKNQYLFDDYPERET